MTFRRAPYTSKDEWDDRWKGRTAEASDVKEAVDGYDREVRFDRILFILWTAFMTVAVILALYWVLS
jgi:hypothetical protein